MFEARIDKGFVYVGMLANGESAPVVSATAIAGKMPVAIKFGYSLVSGHEQDVRPLREKMGLAGCLRSTLDSISDPVIRNFSGIRLSTGTYKLPGHKSRVPFAVLEMRPDTIKGISTQELSGREASKFLVERAISFGESDADQLRSYWSPFEAMFGVVGQDRVDALTYLFEGFLTAQGMGIVANNGVAPCPSIPSLSLTRMEDVPLAWSQRFVAAALEQSSLNELVEETGIYAVLKEAGKSWVQLKPRLVNGGLLFELTAPFDCEHRCQGGTVSLTMLQEWANSQGPIPSGAAIHQISEPLRESLTKLEHQLIAQGLVEVPCKLTFLKTQPPEIGLYLLPTAAGQMMGLAEGAYSEAQLQSVLLHGKPKLSAA